jgi:hypothetical protein
MNPHAHSAVTHTGFHIQLVDLVMVQLLSAFSEGFSVAKLVVSLSYLVHYFFLMIKKVETNLHFLSMIYFR